MNKKFYKILAIIAVAISLSQCIDIPDELILPVWDAELNIPIGSKTYSLSDIIKNQRQIQIDSSTSDRLIKFTSDKIEKDTTLEFLFDNSFDMFEDSSFFLSGQAVHLEMIIRRDSIRIDSAEIQDGTVEYTLTNRYNQPASLNLAFPGITRSVGGTIDTFKISGNVPANSTLRTSTPMADFKYKQPINQPFGSSRPGIWVRGSANLAGSATGDNMGLRIEVKDLKFKNFSGRFAPIFLGSKTETTENALGADIKDLIKAVSFDSVSIMINAFTTFKGFSVGLKNVSVSGVYKNGSPSINLLFNGKSVFDTVFSPGVLNKFIFTNHNTTINDFLNKTPDSIKFSADLVINPNYTSGTIDARDRVSFSVEINAWAKLKINNASITDTINIELSNDARKNILKANNGDLTIEISNGLPLSVQLAGFFTDSSYKKLFYTTRELGTGAPNDTMITLTGAAVDASGRVTIPANKTIKFVFTKDDINKFKDAYFLIQRFNISSSGTQSVLLRADDKVSLNVYGRVSYRIETND
ncbi:MAG: hypothetical protein KJ666_02805 [Bacteroidetes bacterium]|nr:hypothetical protein [Bacteroidota bacterium]MBU2585154.1 hypothetical protein [Bacteroidota bacterium]